MPHHENKNCGRCNAVFECKTGNVLECQCNQIKLSYEERIYIESLYTDCLCIHCLELLQKEYPVFRKQHLGF
jgi:hypothetical protein